MLPMKMIAAAVAVTLLCAAGRPNIAVMPVSRMDQAWWRARFQEKQAELKRGPVDLLWIGDSITQNWERTGPEPWRNFEPIWQRFYGDRHAVNLGFKGDSTCHLLWRLEHGELDGISPRGVVLLIGANNFGHVHTDAEETFAGIQAVLAEIHRRLPATHILLLGVLPSIRSSWVTENTTRLNNELRQFASSGPSYLTYVDVGGLFRHDGVVDAGRFLDPHLTPPDPPLHPSAQTQQQIAATIEPYVARMLGDHPHS
ncbi:acetylhydrolase [Lichenicola cladoniae]|uniref:Acetylhydrolase n=2 Tax=Lichenicola cladoniae TaxID=1484109 RepID=A0A6M8HQ88_9PROT|nr:acetylhydrolase [Acetobacteraceae bacterium]QKE90450.1 acetylhydrolase [Lichenicola cladoniae]